MTLVDNNYPVDDEVRQILEEELSSILVYCQPEEWISLDEIYRRLEVKYTSDRQGSLDALIDETLDQWKWHCAHSGRGRLSYVRRYSASKADKITLANGREVETTESWPPPAHPDAPFERSISPEELLQKLRRTMATRAKKRSQRPTEVRGDGL